MDVNSKRRRRRRPRTEQKQGDASTSTSGHVSGQPSVTEQLRPAAPAARSDSVIQPISADLAHHNAKGKGPMMAASDKNNLMVHKLYKDNLQSDVMWKKADEEGYIAAIHDTVRDEASLSKGLVALGSVLDNSAWENTLADEASCEEDQGILPGVLYTTAEDTSGKVRFEVKSISNKYLLQRTAWPVLGMDASNGDLFKDSQELQDQITTLLTRQKHKSHQTSSKIRYVKEPPSAYAAGGPFYNKRLASSTIPATTTRALDASFLTSDDDDYEDIDEKAPKIVSQLENIYMRAVALQDPGPIPYFNRRRSQAEQKNEVPPPKVLSWQHIIRLVKEDDSISDSVYERLKERLSDIYGTSPEYIEFPGAPGS